MLEELSWLVPNYHGHRVNSDSYTKIALHPSVLFNAWRLSSLSVSVASPKHFKSLSRDPIFISGISRHRYTPLCFFPQEAGSQILFLEQKGSFCLIPMTPRTEAQGKLQLSCQHSPGDAHQVA